MSSQLYYNFCYTTLHDSDREEPLQLSPAVRRLLGPALVPARTLEHRIRAQVDCTAAGKPLPTNSQGRSVPVSR